MSDNIAQQNNLHVFAGVLHCFVTTPKEVKDGIEEYVVQDGDIMHFRFNV